MSNKPVKGLKVGNYRITPLGLVTLGVLLVLVIGGVAIATLQPFGGEDVTVNDVIPDVQPEDEATPVPTDTPEPTATPEPEPRSATIRSLGEIAIQQNLLRSAVNENTFNFDDMFSQI